MERSKIRWAAALLTAVIAMLPAAVSAQSTHGAIVGNAFDPSKAVVPELSVTVTNTGTNIARTLTTNPQGYYEALNLVPGTYRVQAELSGFAPFKRDGVVVESRSTVRIDIPLVIGQRVAEIVEVVAMNPVIETETAALSDTRTALQMEALPMLANGTLFGYVTTLPGVQVVTAAGSTVFSFNGARSGQSEIMFDGMSSARLNTPLAGNPNTMEMTAELKVHSSNNEAEFGSPGVVNLVSKSGTNTLQGTVLYYLSRDQWNEKSRFQATKPLLKQHNFGGTLTGPVVLPGYNGRDKTFFMFSYWGQQQPGQNVFSNTVPTAAMRNGDLSKVGGNITIKDPVTGQPFPGNIIPANRISPAAQRIQQRFYDLPNVGDPNVLTARNRQDNVDRDVHENRYDIRIDQRIGRNNMLFARFNWKGAVQQPLPSTPAVGLVYGWRAHTNFVLSDTHTIRNNLLNEFRTGYTRGGNRQLAGLAGREVIRDLGLTGYPDLDYKSMPIFNISGFAALGFGTPNNLDDHNDIYQVADAVTWTHGNHTLKFGVDIQHNKAYGLDTPGELFGELTFDGSIAGYAYADFLLGLPSRARRATYLGEKSKHGTDTAFFAQDSWRVSRKLTLQLGLRYERQFAIIDEDGRMYNFDPSTGKLVVPDKTVGSPSINPLLPASIQIVSASSAGFPQALRTPQGKNVVPRLGFAWRLSDKTVVRGGYGMFIDSFGTYVSPVQASPLFGYTAEFRNSPASQPYTLTNPFGTGGALVGNLEAGTSSLPTFNPNLQNPRLHQWSLTVERQIKEVGLRLSYVGSRSTNLTYTRSLNVPQPSTTPFSTSRRPYPQFASVYYSSNSSGLQSEYHSLQFDVERRFGKSLYIQGAWTFGKLIEGVDDIGREVGPTIENPYDVKRERALAAFNPSQRLNGAVVWQVPVGRNRLFRSNANPIFDALFGGWQLSSLFYYDTGRRYTPTFTGRDISGTGVTSAQRPDRIADGNLPGSERSLDRWFDTGAFVIPSANIGRFGTSARNVIVGPSSKVIHGTLAKWFRLTERTRFQFQINALNVFNTENFDLSTAALNLSQPATAGKISSVRGGIEAFGPRTINVELRFTF
jgi:hypothetical protein